MATTHDMAHHIATSKFEFILIAYIHGDKSPNDYIFSFTILNSTFTMDVIFTFTKVNDNLNVHCKLIVLRKIIQ